MSAKLERIYWLEFLRHRLLAPIAYDRRHNGYCLTDDSFELPSYWFNPPALLFLAAACNQLRLHHYLGNWYLVGYCHQRRAARIFHASRIIELQLSDETFTAPRFDVDLHIRQSYGIFKGGRQLRQVTLQFDPHMARLVGGMFWHPEQQGESTPARSTR